MVGAPKSFSSDWVSTPGNWRNLLNGRFNWFGLINDEKKSKQVLEIEKVNYDIFSPFGWKELNGVPTVKNEAKCLKQLRDTIERLFR